MSAVGQDSAFFLVPAPVVRDVRRPGGRITATEKAARSRTFGPYSGRLPRRSPRGRNLARHGVVTRCL